jgi:hypothetical protein
LNDGLALATAAVTVLHPSFAPRRPSVGATRYISAEPIPSKTGIVSRNFAAYLKWGGVGRNEPGISVKGSVKGAAMRMKKVGALGLAA